MPSTVGTVTTAGATYDTTQRKTFYANGYYWSFYSDGTNLVYRTSVDGETGSDATIVRACADGARFDVGYFPDYSLSYVYYAYAWGGDLIFRRGTISGNTITWSSEVTVNAGNVWDHPSIGVCTNGRLIIGANLSSGGKTYFYVWTNANNDGSGSWSYTNLTLSEGTDFYRSSILPLTGGKAYALFCKASPMLGNLWNGSSWATNENVTSVGQVLFGATREDDDVHVAYYSGAVAYRKAYRKRTYGASPAWSDEEEIYTADDIYIGITICVDLGTGDLYAVWGQTNTVYYSKKPSGGVWGARTVLAADETKLLTASVNTFKRVWNDVVGVIWTKGAYPTWYVRFDYLLTVIPPVVVKKPIMKIDKGPHPRSRLQFKPSMKNVFG